MLSVSMNSSCRAPAITTCRPVRMRSPNCSMAAVDTTSSRAAASISSGTRMRAAKLACPASAMAPNAAAAQRTVATPISRSGRALIVSTERM
ncbi:hypothetical protein D3C87_1783740 [compost metagenome]